MLSGRAVATAMCVVLVSVTLNFAQQSPLVVTGAISDVSVAGPPVLKDEKPIYRNGLYEREFDLFRIGGRLTLHNRSDETIIVPHPILFTGAKTQVHFLELPSRDSRTVDLVEGFLLGDSSDWNSRLSRELSRPEPSTNYFFVIEPRGFRETGLFLHVKHGYCSAVLTNFGEQKRDVEVAVAAHPYLRLEFSTGTANGLTEAMADARRRWQHIGKLLLTNGGFNFESDVIINKPQTYSEASYTPNCRK